MGYKVEITDKAAVDSEQIVGYLTDRLDNRHAALEFRRGIDAALRLMSTLPESLPPCSDAHLRVRGYRRASVGNYLVLCRVSEHRAVIEDGEVLDHAKVGGLEGVVQVVRVLHGSREHADLV
jgi:plasmid stabilization system protein ParE